MKIPCETIVRFAQLIDPSEDDPVFHTIRLDNGQIIASDRKFMAIENIGGFTGIHHIVVDAALLAQCETEAQYSSYIEITPNDMLKYTVAKTTLGYVTGNIGVWPAAGNAFDRWRDVARQCAEPVAAAKGAMIWHTDGLIRLAKASPSGIVVFEQLIDAETRPTIVRDINSPDWVGLFLPRISDGMYHGAAMLPGWLK